MASSSGIVHVFLVLAAVFAILQNAAGFETKMEAVQVTPEMLAEENAKLNPPNSAVVTLTDDTFDETIASSPKGWFVEFYAPWCGHCKNLVPIWEKLASKAKGKFNVAKVDCTVNEELKTRFNIEGFPTLKFINNSQVYDYTGDRSYGSLKLFVTSKHTLAPSSLLPEAGFVPPANPPPPPPPAEPEYENPNSKVVKLTDSDFDDMTSHGKWLIEFYAPWCGHCKQLAPVWDQLADEASSFTGKQAFKVGKVDCIANEATAKRFGVTGYPTLKMLDRKEDEVCEYNLGRDISSFKKFMKGGYHDASCAEIPQPSASEASSAKTEL